MSDKGGNSGKGGKGEKGNYPYGFKQVY